MEIPIDIIVYLGIFLAVLGRTLFPYLKKEDANKNNPDFAFQVRYIVTAIISAAITAILVFNSFVISSGSAFQVFIAAFIFGWGTNDLLNAMVK